MLKTIKNIRSQSFRGDTPWRVGVGLIATAAMFGLGIDSLNILFFVMTYFWTQSWSYSGHYRGRRFRPSFMRLVMEVYWPIKEAAMKYTGLKRKFIMGVNYLVPIAFCFLLISLSNVGNIFFSIAGALVGAFVIRIFNEFDRDDLDESKNDLGFESEEGLNEVGDLVQSHQKDSERDL